MSVEDFQFTDNESIDNSLIKRDVLERYHQQGALYWKYYFFSKKNNNCHQTCKKYLEFQLTLGKNRVDFKRNDVDSNVDEHIRLMSFAFAHAFSIATISTRGGMDLEQNKYVGLLSSKKRISTSSKEGDLIPYFDKVDKTWEGKRRSSLSRIIFDNHQPLANGGKIKGQKPLEHLFAVWKKNLKSKKLRFSIKPQNIRFL